MHCRPILCAAALGLLLARPGAAAPRVALGEFRITGAEARAFRWDLLAREGLRQRLAQAGVLELVDASGAPEYLVSGSVGGPAGTSILAVKVQDVARDVLVASHHYPFGLADGLPLAIGDAARNLLARLSRPRPGALLFTDPFTDTTLASWDVIVPSGLGKDLSVEEGALRLRSQVALLTKAALPRDAVIRCQMRFEDNARAQLAVLIGSQAPYPRQLHEVALFPDRAYLFFREGIPRNLGSAQLLSLSPWQWYDLTIEVWNSEIRFWIDGALVASMPAGQLKGGQVGFRGSECWIDNLRVQAIDGVRD